MEKKELYYVDDQDLEDALDEIINDPGTDGKEVMKNIDKMIKAIAKATGQI